MASEPLMARIDQIIEELMRVSDRDAAAVASILMAAQAAIRRGELTDLALASWAVVDARWPAPQLGRPTVGV